MRIISSIVRFAKYILIAIAILAFIFCLSLIFFRNKKVSFLINPIDSIASAENSGIFVASHISTPKSVKAIYMTACTASMDSLRNKVLENISGTEINSIVIDVKDYTGTISNAKTKLQKDTKQTGCLISDLQDFITRLHGMDYYVIGRITVFQDPTYSRKFPELAVKSKTNSDGIWKDKNGLSYIDPSAKPYWDYVINLAKESYGIGFDEINFDYIRFPSDGVLSDARYSWSEGMKKNDALRKFFLYLREQLNNTGIVMSADLFGLTTSVTDDLGIGQVLEDAFPYFDYIAPMVYPSHFASGFNGFDKPATKPYEVILISMKKAVERANLASTSPYKLRPWLQDFNLGAKYTPEMVRDQIRATYDSGLNSWMLWNAGSSYQRSALLLKDVEKK
jgi:hypothetical protein